MPLGDGWACSLALHDVWISYAGLNGPIVNPRIMFYEIVASLDRAMSARLVPFRVLTNAFRAPFRVGVDGIPNSGRELNVPRSDAAICHCYVSYFAANRSRDLSFIVSQST
jgi:hypothetical protein